MNDNKRKELLAAMYSKASSVGRLRSVTSGFEYKLLSTYEELRAIEKDFDEGSFIIEGVGGKAFYDKLMELFGVIEGRITELGLK